MKEKEFNSSYPNCILFAKRNVEINGIMVDNSKVIIRRGQKCSLKECLGYKFLRNYRHWRVHSDSGQLQSTNVHPHAQNNFHFAIIRLYASKVIHKLPRSSKSYCGKICCLHTGNFICSPQKDICAQPWTSIYTRITVVCTQCNNRFDTMLWKRNARYTFAIEVVSKQLKSMSHVSVADVTTKAYIYDY